MSDLNFTPIDKITGYLTQGEAELLFECAMETAAPKVLELGTYLGKSAAVLATAMKYRKGILMCCDDFKEGKKVENVIYADPLQLFWKSMSALGLSQNIIAIKGNTRDVLSKLSGKFGMIYIDAGHTAVNVIADGIYAWDHVFDGGLIVFHDYENSGWPDVTICVDILLKKWDRKIYKRDHLLVAIKK